MSEAPYEFVQCDANGCEKSDGLKICGNCKCYAFCSRKCQALFWKAGGHKKVCDSLKHLRENGVSAADIRESDGDPSKLLDMNKTPSSKPFQSCCSVKGCKCVTKEGDHVAIYRQLDGESFFTGMVAVVDGSGLFDFSKMMKLHNAGDDIYDAEHHIMNPDEIMTEFAHYDDGPKSIQEDLAKVGLVKLGSPQSCPFQPKMPLSPLDMLLYKKCEMCGLVDFSHKPPEYFDMKYAEDKFDVKYPFPDGLKPVGGSIKIQNGRDSGLPRWANFDVRAHDDVRVLVAGVLPPGSPKGPAGMPFTEKMWVDVISITSFGMITGIPRVPVEDAMGYLANKDKAKLLSFPITCVVGVQQYKKEDGGYW